MVKALKGILCVLLALCVFSVGLTAILTKYSHYLNDFFGTVDSVVSNENATAENARFKSDYFANKVYNPSEKEYTKAEAEKYLEDKLAFIEQTVSEGVVLLKNNGVLPFDKSSKVTALGRGSADIHYCASSGSGIIPTTNALTLEQAFDQNGVSLNKTALEFYKGRSEKFKTAEGGNKATIGETPVSAYTDAVKDSFKQFNDVAIVIFTRPGGEGNDLVQNGGTDFEGSQLNLNKDEKDVLELAKANFEKVIVILNCDNPIGIGDMKNDDKIDSIIWAGGLGINGTNALVKLLIGEYNFSGKLSDTFAIDSMSGAAAQNCGKYTYQNADAIKDYVKHDLAAPYVVEAEGIYIGYKYYETRYEDSVLGGRNADCAEGIFASKDGKWDYAAEMGYTFGFGLSYTTFDQKILSVDFNDDKSIANVKVSVTNTGNKAGKDVAQIWIQTPYTEYDKANGIEKSAIQLADYVKTDLLQPGETKEYTVEVQMANCATYDSKGAKTFIMDAGDYYFALGNGAHDGLNNVLAAKGYTTADGMDYDGDKSKTFKWTLGELDKETFSTSRWTGEEITNLFDEADLNYWIDNGVVWLTRSDWTTFPKTYDTLTTTQAMIERLACNENITGVDYSYGEYDNEPKVVYQSHETDIALYELAGKDFDDPMWEDLLDQLSMRDTSLIIGIGNCETVPIESIHKQKTMGGDGPTGFSGLISGQTFNGGKATLRLYFSENLCTATWSKDLAYKFGYFIGEDALFTSKTDLWGPGANLHRTPFSGRNVEYPSEDGVLGFEQLASQCKGMSDKGVIAAPKHFAFNDQENNRNGLSVFVNEQSAREIILKIYEGCFTEGHAMGTMSSFPRIGLDYMGMSYNLLTKWLRDEIGFLGYVTTDMAGSTFYMRPPESVKAGVTIYDNNSTEQADLLFEAMQDDETLQKAMRRAAHYTLYAFANSNAMNGYDENTFTIPVTPWWKATCYGLEIGFGVLTVACAALYVVALVKKSKEVE